MTKQERLSMKLAEASQCRRQLRIDRTKKLFIEAAYELIQEHGLQNISIRKLADVTGYGTATLYSYFQDLDELIIFASIKNRREYLLRLSREIHNNMTSLEQYEKLYEVFNVYSFAAPSLYLNMYFGTHAEHIGEILNNYYALYPEEETALPPFLFEALQQRNLFLCDQVFTRRLAQDGFILPEHIEMVAEIIVRVQETLMYEIAVHPHLDPEAQNQKFMSMFHHVIQSNAPPKEA